jgi:hypothetical protein
MGLVKKPAMTEPALESFEPSLLISPGKPVLALST